MSPSRWRRRSWTSWDPAAGAPGPTHLRRDNPEGGKTVWWSPAGYKAESLLYYATPPHRPYQDGELVILTEGEKAADAVAEAGYKVAATVCGAAGDPSDAVVADLARYRVVLAPDNDEVGRAHMGRIRARLERAGVRELRWAEPPEGAPKGWDLADAPTGARVEVVAASEIVELVLSPEDLEAIDAAMDAAPPAPVGGTGLRTMGEISTDPPHPPLVGEFLGLHPGEGAILYGPGGSTKGTTAAWLAREHVRADPDAVVLVLDFEHHEAEWGGRLRRLGCTTRELDRMHYASPYSSRWTAPRGLLSEVKELVRADCDRLGVSLLIVDSITTAAAAGETMGGQKAASEYFDALAHIGRRSLSLAHVKGDASRWPDRPFGSVHLHNLARETWAIAVISEGSEGPDTRGLTFTQVELRCKKANGRRRPRNKVVTYQYQPHHGEITAKLEDRKLDVADLIHAAMRATSGNPWLSDSQLVGAVETDTGEKLTKTQVYDAIRNDRRGRFEVDTSTRPRKYRAKP